MLEKPEGFEERLKEFMTNPDVKSLQARGISTKVVETAFLTGWINGGIAESGMIKEELLRELKSTLKGHRIKKNLRQDILIDYGMYLALNEK